MIPIYQYKGGILIAKSKKIKWNNRVWSIKVSDYDSKRMCLKLKSNELIQEITIDLPDAFLIDNHIMLDPKSTEKGIVNALKKYRIIRRVEGVLYYNYLPVPIAQVNMGILRDYDNEGVINYLDKVGGIKN